MRGYRGPHETTSGRARAARHSRRMSQVGGYTRELGGHLDRRLVGSDGGDRGADEGQFFAGSGDDAGRVGNAAAFLASDRAGATGTVFNLTSGTVVD